MTTEELQERLLTFAINSYQLVSKLPKSISNKEYGSQLIRSSASPGANYIEAIEAESKKDFIHRLKICKKEAKESTYWLTLIKSTNDSSSIDKDLLALIQESKELVRIFSSSIKTAETNTK